MKGFLEAADVALILLTDNAADLFIIGWELEGELPSSGIEFRSEGGVFYDRREHQHHTELILGAEYGFPNSLTLTLEYSYDERLDVNRIGCISSYRPTPLLTLSLLGLYSLTDESHFFSPTFSYSLGDETTLSGGILFYHGDEGDEYGIGENTLYLNWFIHL